MQIPPLENVREGSCREMSGHDAVGDTNRDLLPPVPRVEMGWIVFVVVDHDHDPEKATDLRYRKILRRDSVRVRVVMIVIVVMIVAVPVVVAFHAALHLFDDQAGHFAEGG